MLLAYTRGPTVLLAEVPIDGGLLLLALAEPGDRLTLLPSCADPSIVQLDAAAVDALIQVLVEVRGRMGELQAGIHSGGDHGA